MTNKLLAITILFFFLGVSILSCEPLKVVTTLSDYAYFAKEIGGVNVDVSAIVLGNQDAHFIRPKPSFVTRVAKADLLVATGLDLELWLPTVINRSGNRNVRSGQPGYVATAHGMKMMEVPKVLSRSEGGLHIFGNPHVTCSPINMRVAATNITSGFIKNMPEQSTYFKNMLKGLKLRLDNKLFGEKLVQLFGGDLLCRLAEKGKLTSFLEKKEYEGNALIESLGGWMKKMMPLRGQPIVTYHKNWVYFLKLFGMIEAGTVEPKPGIPPSPRHRAQLISMMKKRNIKILLAANYFNTRLAKSLAQRVGAKAVIVPLYVNGGKDTEDYFKLVDHWIDSLIVAAKDKGVGEIER